MRMPDTIRTEKPELEEKEWASVRDALKQALGQVEYFQNARREDHWKMICASGWKPSPAN